MRTRVLRAAPMLGSAVALSGVLALVTHPLAALPLLVLLTALALGTFPGEELLARARDRRAVPDRPLRAPLRVAPRAWRTLLVPRVALLARAHGRRGPPAGRRAPLLA